MLSVCRDVRLPVTFSHKGRMSSGGHTYLGAHTPEPLSPVGDTGRPVLTCPSCRPRVQVGCRVSSRTLTHRRTPSIPPLLWGRTQWSPADSSRSSHLVTSQPLCLLRLCPLPSPSLAASELLPNLKSHFKAPLGTLQVLPVPTLSAGTSEDFDEWVLLP